MNALPGQKMRQVFRLNYQQRLSGEWWRRWRVAIAIGVVGAAVVLGASSVRSWWNTTQGNAPWRYPEKMGVDQALSEIALAVKQYQNQHGSLPATLPSVAPLVHRDQTNHHSVSSTAMLPYVMMLTRADPGVPALPGSPDFVLIVYLRKSGPMHWDVADVLYDGQRFSNLFFDDDLLRNFGSQRTKQLKSAAYQLP